MSHDIHTDGQAMIQWKEQLLQLLEKVLSLLAPKEQHCRYVSWIPFWPRPFKSWQGSSQKQVEEEIEHLDREVPWGDFSLG